MNPLLGSSSNRRLWKNCSNVNAPTTENNRISSFISNKKLRLYSGGGDWGEYELNSSRKVFPPKVEHFGSFNVFTNGSKLLYPHLYPLKQGLDLSQKYVFLFLGTNRGRVAGLSLSCSCQKPARPTRWQVLMWMNTI